MAGKAATVAVVGSGPIGLHVAERLHLDGADVTVLTAEPDARTISHRQVAPAAAGLIEPVATEPDDADLVDALFATSYPLWLARCGDPGLPVDRRRVVFRPAPGAGPPSWAPGMYGYSERRDGTVAFESAVVSAPMYAAEARRRLAARGVRFKVRILHHLEQVTGAYDVVVNATGPGAWALGDRAMYGRRGLLVWFPPDPDVEEVRFDDESFSYVIPARHGIAVGGTADPATGDPAKWPTTASSDEIERLLDGAVRLYPRVRWRSRRPLAVRVTYRPCRTNLRLERVATARGCLVHATGFGGSGWTLAPGAADHVRVLVAGVPGFEGVA